jgi:hypothetical protein
MLYCVSLACFEEKTTHVAAGSRITVALQNHTESCCKVKNSIRSLNNGVMTLDTSSPRPEMFICDANGVSHTSPGQRPGEISQHLSKR